MSVCVCVYHMYVCVLICVGVYTHACGNQRLSFFFDLCNNWCQVTLSSALPSIASQIDPENSCLCLPRTGIICWTPYFLSIREDFQIQTSVFMFVLHAASPVTHLPTHKNQISMWNQERINYIQIRAILGFTCLLWYLKGKKRIRLLILSLPLSITPQMQEWVNSCLKSRWIVFCPSW